MSKSTVILLVVIGCILLAAANVALWATLDVFNADRFGEHVAKGLQSEASVEALAGPIVDRLMVGYPDFPPLLQGPAEEAVAWSLQRPVFTAVFKETAAIANKVMTTSAEDVVGIDLGGVIDNAGSTIVGVISALDAEAGASAQTALDTVEQGERLAIYESGRNNEFQVVAVNDLGDAETNAHLTRFDTAHDPFPGEVAVEGDHMIVNGDRIRVCAERNPADLPWG